MPRDHARVNLTIWGDPDFRLLPPAAQHLYLALWTSPDLDYAGVHDWRPGRMNGLWAGFTVENVRTVADCLQARHFLVVDEDTEEVLIRSWARFDGLMKQPRMAVSLVNTYASLSSKAIRAVLVRELNKIRKEEPGLTCWSDRRVAEVLDHPSVSAKDLPTPSDPFGPDPTSSLPPGLALGLPQTPLGVWPYVCTPPTPTPTTTTKPLVVKGGAGGTDAPPKAAGRKRPAKPLPKDWQPNDHHREIATERNVDADSAAAKFRDHAEANDRRQVDWNAAFRQWLRNERPGTAPVRSDNRKVNAPLEQPPDGLTDEQMSAWWQERRRA